MTGTIIPGEEAPVAPPTTTSTQPTDASGQIPDVRSDARSARRANVVKEPARLGIVLVNWNRWADTIECLESVFRSTIPIRVIVVDNASDDGSIDRIVDWAAGALPATAANPEMARLSQPPQRKPIAVRRLKADEIAAAGGASDVPLTIVSSGSNRGFAGGNNIGLRLLLSDPRMDHFWLLNNDTVIEPTAAAAVVSRLTATHNVGMCGTIVRFYYEPELIQALNGSRFNLWTGQSRGIGLREPISAPFDPQRVAAETDFVLGASLATSRVFLETVGPMDESFFLYYEEIEWARRGGHDFTIGFAQGATVFHKHGGSTGPPGQPSPRSSFSDYWLTRSRLVFIRRYAPVLLAWHWLLTFALVGRRILRGKFSNARAMLGAMFGQKF